MIVDVGMMTRTIGCSVRCSISIPRTSIKLASREQIPALEVSAVTLPLMPAILPIDDLMMLGLQAH